MNDESMNSEDFDSKGFDRKWRKLAEFGATGFDHITGPLIDHLRGTQALLREWSASAELQDAGLYHAAYGTSGFEQGFVSLGQRGEIGKIIGVIAEEIVYQYCACDREDYFAKVGREKFPEFVNRFTGECYFLNELALQRFCELTAANEVEIAMADADFLEEYGEELGQLFFNMKAYLSPSAQEAVEKVFSAYLANKCLSET